MSFGKAVSKSQLGTNGQAYQLNWHLASQTVFSLAARGIFEYPTDLARARVSLYVANRSIISRSKGFPKIDSCEAVGQINWQFSWSYEIFARVAGRISCFFWACCLLWKVTSSSCSGSVNRAYRQNENGEREACCLADGALCWCVSCNMM